jgi:hypothetical protein
MRAHILARRCRWGKVLFGSLGAGPAVAVARPRALYEIVDPESNEVLSRHKRRSAAIDNWRMQFTGRNGQSWLRAVPGVDTLIVECVWHEAG